MLGRIVIPIHSKTIRSLKIKTDPRSTVRKNKKWIADPRSMIYKNKKRIADPRSMDQDHLGIVDPDPKIAILPNTASLMINVFDSMSQFLQTLRDSLNKNGFLYGFFFLKIVVSSCVVALCRCVLWKLLKTTKNYTMQR